MPFAMSLVYALIDWCLFTFFDLNFFGGCWIGVEGENRQLGKESFDFKMVGATMTNKKL